MTELLPINPVPVSIKFQIASNLAKLLEAQNRPEEWNFPDAVTLEIHEDLLKQIDRGEGATLINQFVAAGGEIDDSDFHAEARISRSALPDSKCLQLWN
jgi:hypothetical protein